MSTNVENKMKRVTIFGVARSAKSCFMPFLNGELEPSPPSAKAIRKYGYITKETERKLIETWANERCGTIESINDRTIVFKMGNKIIWKMIL